MTPVSHRQRHRCVLPDRYDDATMYVFFIGAL
jgi:hypothetical protein